MTPIKESFVISLDICYFGTSHFNHSGNMIMGFKNHKVGHVTLTMPPLLVICHP